MKYLFPALIVLALAACRPEGDAPQASAPAGPGDEVVVDAPEAPEQVPELVSGVETDPRYIIGITWPPEANRHPDLARELHAYVEQARTELMDSVQALEDESPRMLYELSLRFTTEADTPDLLVIAADGTLYTGGAHGAPLVARFVWLNAEERRLAVTELFEGEEAWRGISSLVREQLHASLSQRIDADELDPDERNRLARSMGRMIDQGSGPEAENFSEFEPVAGPDRKVSAIRFVFPPYQVGPYSDGIQVVEIPAAQLLPLASPQYRGLFSGGA